MDDDFCLAAGCRRGDVGMEYVGSFQATGGPKPAIQGAAGNATVDLDRRFGVSRRPDRDP